MTAAQQHTLFTDVEALDRWNDQLDRYRTDINRNCCHPHDDLGANVIRCGRCGHPIASYDRTINHDKGWSGCPRHVDPQRQHPSAQASDDPTGWLSDRHDRQHYPDCGRCGHPWGLHQMLQIALWPPSYASCIVHCGCPGYLPPPPGYATRFGTCPGCWTPPHDGPCPDRPVTRGAQL